MRLLLKLLSPLIAIALVTSSCGGSERVANSTDSETTTASSSTQTEEDQSTETQEAEKDDSDETAAEPTTDSEQTRLYIDEDGEAQVPLCIHRAPLGTHERFIGFLIEHFGGNFPLWLTPVQVAVLPVSDKVIEYARDINAKLRKNFIRSNIDSRSEKIGSKIRNAELSKINVMIIVGEKEQAQNKITVRKRFIGDTGTTDLNSFIAETKNEIKNRRLPHSKKTETKS